MVSSGSCRLRGLRPEDEHRIANADVPVPLCTTCSCEQPLAPNEFRASRQPAFEHVLVELVEQLLSIRLEVRLCRERQCLLRSAWRAGQPGRRGGAWLRRRARRHQRPRRGRVRERGERVRGRVCAQSLWRARICRARFDGRWEDLGEAIRAREYPVEWKSGHWFACGLWLVPEECVQTLKRQMYDRDVIVTALIWLHRLIRMIHHD